LRTGPKIWAAHPQTREHARHPARGRFDLPLSPPNAHEIAILVNELDTSGAFQPTRQFAYGNAFTQSGFGAATGFGVDAVDVTLPISRHSAAGTRSIFSASTRTA
jgi:hypothetical protein